MAKKKKSQANSKEQFPYSVELLGLFLILLGIIGFGFGPVGAMIKKFAIFLVGTWWLILLFIVLFIGIYMLFKRKLPKFMSSRLVGLYVLIIVVLALSHLGFVENSKTAGDIMHATIDNFMDRINSIGTTSDLFTSGATSIEVGGGILGAVFSIVLTTLFGITGTKIVAVALVLFGFILLFNITFADILNKIKSAFVSEEDEDKEPKKLKKDKLGLLPAKKANKDEKDDKIIITSMEELNPIKSPNENNKITDNTYLEQAQNYKLPTLDLLDDVKENKKIDNSFTKSNKEILEQVLKDFQIEARVVAIHIGPSVTQYELVVPNGTKLTRISNINKEIALALAAKDVIIQTPIPGKSTIGVEIPNPKITPVKVKEILSTTKRGAKEDNVIVALGKNIMGTPITMDIAKTPHLLVAGSTGSGKSVCINTIIASILMRYRPDEVKIVLVDPKKVELSNYNGVPHLLCPVVTDAKKASVTLQRIVAEMEKRYDTFSDTKVKNITTYNAYIDKENEKNNSNLPRMPYIVVIIDELADLMLVASKEVEDSIMRITQMARAAGIHLIVATQRPSTDVITGVVKANIPSRISFAVSSQIDSRTILDASGAEKLLGKGDMLYLPMGANMPTRIQGCFISDDEIKRIIDYVCSAGVAKYDENIMVSNNETATMAGSSSSEEYEDPLYNEIVEFAISTGKISASLIQRRFRLGYNRAARIVDLLEERGIIGPQNGSKPREVLVKLEEKNDEE